MSIKINWWLRETSRVLFLPFKGNWNGSVVMVRWWPSPGAAKHPCQIPAEPLGSFGPVWPVLGQALSSVLAGGVALSSVLGWGGDPKPWESDPSDLAGLWPGLAATGAWGRIWPHSRRIFHPHASAGASENVPGCCTLTRVQLWTLMDYK